MHSRVFLFTGLGRVSGFADVLQDRVSLFIFSILFFLGATQLRRARKSILYLSISSILKSTISIRLFSLNCIAKAEFITAADGLNKSGCRRRVNSRS